MSAYISTLNVYSNIGIRKGKYSWSGNLATVQKCVSTPPGYQHPADPNIDLEIFSHPS